MPDHYTDLFTLLTFRGQTKPSKKAKLNKPVDNSNPSEPEKQQPESSHPIAEATIDDPLPENHEASIDHMDVEPVIAKPQAQLSPPKKKLTMLWLLGLVTQHRVTPLSYPSITLRKKFPLMIKASGR